MTDTHPLGDITGNGTTSPTAVDVHGSIVDQVLDLDDFLSSDVRLALKQAAFYTRPDLEAEIEERNAELDALTDSQGRPLPVMDKAIGDGTRTAQTVAQEVADLQKEYAASRRVIVLQQLNEDDWAEFQTKWKSALQEAPPYPPEFYVDLLARSAISPKLPADKIPELRQHVGAPAFEAIWRAAWHVNTRSGVDIPKSLLSSAVLRLQQHG